MFSHCLSTDVRVSVWKLQINEQVSSLMSAVKIETHHLLCVFIYMQLYLVVDNNNTKDIFVFLLKKLAPSNVNDLKNELSHDKRGKANKVRKSCSALGTALGSKWPSLTIHSRTMVCLVQTTKSLKWILRTKSAAGLTNNTSGSCSAAHLCQSTAVGLCNIWSCPRWFFYMGTRALNLRCSPPIT